MKYIVMMFGDQASMLERRSVAWAREMVEFMHKLNDDLTRAGELVAAEGQADATQAKTDEDLLRDLYHLRRGSSAR